MSRVGKEARRLQSELRDVGRGLNKLKTGQIDQAWSAKKAWQQEFHGGRLLGAEFTSSRYEKFAELCKDKGNCGLRCELRWTAETPRSV